MGAARVAASLPPTIFETFPRVISKVVSSPASSASSPAILHPRRNIAMANNPTSSSPQQQQPPLTFQNYKVESTSISTATGVNLSDQQQVITGSVLDLFAGRPSLRKLSLWKDDATFADPLTIAEGRKQYAPQWYGLKAAFSEIQRLGSRVTSSGNPIELDLKTRYKVKGIGSEQTIDSKVKIFTEGDGDHMRITKVEDRWNGELPEGGFATAMRNLNSVTVPALVSVPKSIEEEEGGH